MKKIILLLNLTIVLILFESCKKVSNNPLDITISEGCITINKDDLEIVENGVQYSLTNYLNFIITFDELNDAEFVLKIIEYYNFDEFCSIGAYNNFSYFLVNGEIPVGAYGGGGLVYCIAHDINRQKVILTSGGKYTIVEPHENGFKTIYSAKTEAEAHEILEILKRYDSSFGCYIDRRIPFHYLRK